MKKSRAYWSVLSLLMVLAAWWVLTLFFPPIVIPRISEVFKDIGQILTTARYLDMMWITMRRMLAGIGIGVGIGLAAGIGMGKSQAAYQLISPILGIFQTIPPVCWVVLAIVWFGFNGWPAIFIVILAVIPIIAVNIAEGIRGISPRYLEMAKIYRFSRKKVFRHITIPSIMPYFRSALELSIGSAWKICVMGEVLTVTDGIGGMIKAARQNIEPDKIMAWSILIVLLFYLTDWIIHLFFARWKVEE